MTTQPAESATSASNTTGKVTGTEYVVLRQTRRGTKPEDAQTRIEEQWERIGTAIQAANAKAAIREASKRTTLLKQEHDVVLVAIPALSFKPVKVKTEQVTRVTLHDA